MRKIYTMRCKSPFCKIEGGYRYRYVGEWYEYEHCPICGHGANFDEFKDSEEDVKESSYHCERL
uniref:Uncharacterized protein n=1 Tax=viral metagenome TaxID=1070528 RepID=A0A6M3L7P1_9ZZZZ